VRGVTQTADGRTARSARTREAVVTAVLDLVRAGNMRPTAKEIAARAGISLRSVYVHFDDLDDLFAAAGARQAEEVAHLLYTVDAGLPLDARIAAVVQQRAAIWEVLAPVRRAAMIWSESSRTLQAGSERMTTRAIRDLARVFTPELDHWGDNRTTALEALHVATSSGAWDVLRNERGLTVGEATAVLATTMTRLLDAPTSRSTPNSGRA
jgi:TetR/AcrR family transcriptional regulator, regulator of autoinduction and epiphytic fitness